MLKYIRTSESYDCRSEDVYTEKNELLFTIHITYSSEYEDGGNRMEEYIDHVVAHFDLKGESALDAFNRIEAEEHHKDRCKHQTFLAHQKREKRNHDPIWNQRMEAARLLIKHHLKEPAKTLVREYLENHRS